MTQPLHLGILSTANIANKFIDAAKASPHIVFAAVGSRDAGKANAFAQKHNIAASHNTYEALLADATIEAIYNPLPNSLHAQWCIRAAHAGKHVLCEKPLASNANEAREIFAAARANNVKIVEAYPYRAQAYILKVAELVRDGAIGRPRLMQASFGFSLAGVSATNVRWNAALAGGALMDAGSYPVSFVRLIAGECASRAHAFAHYAESGVDHTLSGSYEFPSGFFAQIACSFDTARHRPAVIVGDAGMIETTFFNDTSAAQPARFTLTRGTAPDAKAEIFEFPSAPGFLLEAESFYKFVRGSVSDWNGATPEESIDIARMLDALALSAREKRIVGL